MADITSDLPTSTLTDLTEYAAASRAYSVISNAVISANTAETALIYINNSVANSKTIYLAAGLLIASPSQANWVNFKIYYNPTVTSAGTTISPANFNALSNTAPNAVMSSSPTVTANGLLVDFIPNELNNALGGMVTKQSFDPCYIIPPGRSCLITGLAKANGTPVVIVLNWFER